MSAYMTTRMGPAIRACLDKYKFPVGHSSHPKFLMAFNGELWEIDSGLCCMRCRRGYHAIGCGADYALGALHATKSRTDPWNCARHALEAACEHDIHCKPPFTFQEF